MKTTILKILFLVFISCSSKPDQKVGEVEVYVDSAGLRIEMVEKPSENSMLISFLENPIDLQEYKKVKGKSLSSVAKGRSYYYRPNIKDSIFYNYSSFPANSDWTKMEPLRITVFKFGENKHSWEDTTEILIELRVEGKDEDLKAANLIGYTKDQMEAVFGQNYLILDHRMIYSYNNKILIVTLEDATVSAFRYLKLNTNSIDTNLIKQILE